MSKSSISQRTPRYPSPESLQELFSQAVTAHQAGKYDVAEALYRQILQDRPDNVNLLCNLGLLYREAGERARGLQVLERALALDPENASVLLNVGAIHEDAGDLEQAEAVFRRAAELAPHDPRVLNNLGKVLSDKGQRQEALTLLQRAVAIAPEYVLAQNNLGVLLTSLGQNEKALAAFLTAIRLDPENLATRYNLAGSLSLAGDLAGAAEQYRQILAVDPGNGSARHMLAACSGGSPAQAPADYVVDTFDRYAGYFDEQLVTRLAYRVPDLLAKAVREHASGSFRRCLDLGCGTGLSGQAFQGLARSLVGVDLSAGMLRQAQEKGVYDALHCCDIVNYLVEETGSFDLFVATDVFIYIGQLLRVFQEIRAKAADRALLAFSIETGKQGDFTLRPSGRYAHSPSYITRLSQACGMEEVHSAPCTIRQELGEGIAGHLYIFQMR